MCAETLTHGSELGGQLLLQLRLIRLCLRPIAQLDELRGVFLQNLPP
jgi:hypothetical protein